MDIINHNKSAWDNYVDKKDRWTIPVSEEELEQVKKGIWSIVLTPNKTVPHDWFPDFKGLKMRIPGIGGEVFSRAGGTAVNMPGGEIFTSLQTGVIDAAEWVAPYNDLAFGFYNAAKFYYYPGWHEPGAILEFIINKTAYESLPSDLAEIVKVAARAVNQDMLDEYTARNNAALNDLRSKDIKILPLPDDVIARLKTISGQVIEESAAADPMFKKVYGSYSDFLKNVSDYHAISEEAYYKIRRQN